MVKTLSKPTKVLKKSAPAPPVKTLSKKSLSKPPAPVKRDLHPVVPASVKKSIRKDHYKENFLIDISDGPIRMNPKRNIETTYLRVGKADRRIKSIITIMPDGVHLSWDVCGVCHQYFTLCPCPMGVSAARSVEYIFDKTNADMKKEPWDYHHPNYRGSLTKADREARQNRMDSRIIGPGFVPTIPGQEDPAEAREGGKKRLSKPGGPKTLTKPSKPLTRPSKPLPKEAEDIGALNRAADNMAEAMTKRLQKSMEKKPLVKKTLRKVK